MELQSWRWAAGLRARSPCRRRQTVSTSVKLAKDLWCEDDGIIVGADGITIDLNGHTLGGARDPLEFGIDNGAGYDGVSVVNGVVRNFDYGVLGGATGSPADRMRLKDVVVSGNAFHGIFIRGVSALVASSQGSGNAETGVRIIGASAVVRSSHASGNGVAGISVTGDSAVVGSSHASGNVSHGIKVEGTSPLVEYSHASGNTFHGIFIVGDSARIRYARAWGNDGQGIEVDGDAARITRNRAEANGFIDGTSDGLGLGIFVRNFTTAPVGATSRAATTTLGSAIRRACADAPLG